MKSFYYDIDNAAFTDQSGEKLARCVPELFYQERAEWRIFLRDGENLVPDLSGVVAWGAAVGNSFCAGSPPMCRTLSDGITADVETGSVTVMLDAATPEFLAAINGAAVKPAWFELYGLDGSGRMVFHAMFEIRAHMRLDPDPAADTDTPDTVATKAYTSALIDGRLENYPTLGSAREIAGGAAARATSGAIFSGAEITTTVGPYTVALTSGGGLAVSGSGASVVLSGGEIAAKTAEGGSMSLGADGSVNIYTAGHNININADGGGDVNINGTNIPVSGELSVNSRPVATQLVTSTEVGAATAYVSVLSGGTSYVFTDPADSLIVDSAVKTTEASYIHFALDSVTAPTPVVISGVSYLNSATFEGGKEYLVGFFDGMAVVNEVTSGGAV